MSIHFHQHLDNAFDWAGTAASQSPCCSALDSPLPEQNVISNFQSSATESEFQAVIKFTSQCMAKIVTGTRELLGCGILIGIDRLLVPLHVVHGNCPSDIKVLFEGGDAELCICYEQSFDVLAFHGDENGFDFAFLQVSRATSGSFPGDLFVFPSIACDPPANEFLLQHVDSDGYKAASVGEPCKGTNWEGHFCAYSNTVKRSSGGGYFNSSGQLFAMHLSRSTGACFGTDQERKAILLRDIVRCHPNIFSEPCKPLCPPVSDQCLPAIVFDEQCFSNEGGPPVKDKVEEQIKKIKVVLHYIEYRKSHGPTERGIIFRLNPPKTYQFDINPHEIKDYKKNDFKKAPELYKKAAEFIFSNYFKQSKPLPPSFQFEAYRISFTANEIEPERGYLSQLL